MDTTDTPARPEGGEVAGRSVGMRLQNYIGEISPDPRQPSGWAIAGSDRSYQLRLGRNTLRDEQIYSTLEQRILAAVSVPWEIQPGGDRRIDRQAADNIRKILAAADIDQVSAQMLHNSIWHGYSVAEAIWAPGDGMVVIEKLITRAPDRFRFGLREESAPDNVSDHPLLLRTLDKPRGEPVGPAKFWVLRNPGEHGDVPHGPGLARWCYWIAILKRLGIKYWAQSLERYAAPVPVGKYPKGADDGERRKLLDIVRNVAAGAGVTLPEGQELEYLIAGARVGADYKDFCAYLDALTAKVILGQSSTTEQGPWRGTAEVQMQVRDEVVQADCQMLSRSLNRTLVKWLHAWNHPRAEMPSIARDHSVSKEGALKARAEREEIVARTSGLRPTQAYIERTYGGEWELSPRPAMGPQFANPAIESEIRGAVEAELADDGWRPLLAPTIKPLLDALAAEADRGTTLREFADQLPNIARTMDAGALAEQLGAARFAAAAAGALEE